MTKIISQIVMMGAIHSTKNFHVLKGTVFSIRLNLLRRGLIPIPLETNFVLIFKMADGGCLLFVVELVEDFEVLNDIVDDDDDLLFCGALSCFM